MKPDQLEEFVPESLRIPPPRVTRPMRRDNTSTALAESALGVVEAIFYAFLLLMVGWVIAQEAGQGVFAIWAVCGIVGAAVGEMKGNIKAGTLWAVFLGPLGLIIVVMMPNKIKIAQAAAQAAAHEAQQARLVQLQEAQLRELQELRARLGTEAPKR